MDRLTLRDLAWLSVFGLVARLAAAFAVDYAPYTDPAYYTLVAQQLAAGHGFSVPVIWSFLEVGSRLPDPAVLPVPSNGHWMPLTSILAAGPMWLFGPSFRAGQLPMIVLSAALVPATAVIAAWLFSGRWVILGSAVLAIFAGPLLVYYPTIENFAVFGVLGAGAIAAAIRAVQVPNGGRWLVLSGLLAGGATLARIDGVLLAIAPATAWVARGEFRTSRGWAIGVASAMAFLLVLAPWLGRNVAVFGTPLPGAGGSTLWITSYNEQFSIGHDVTFGSYLASGPTAILGSKLESWFDILGRTAVLLGGTFLFTFVPGLWMARRRRELWPFVAYIVVLFAVMGGLFTFHAPKGAWYHSAPAWLPFAIPLSLASLPTVANAVGRLWPFLRRPQTHRFLAVIAIAGAVVLSMVGSLTIWHEWDRSHRLDLQGAAFFQSRGATDDVVMYPDPATLALLSGNPGVAPSFDPFPILERIVRAYHVRWVMVQLPEGAARDALGLWDGGSAHDVDGNRATWLADTPSLDVPGLRIFAVKP